jgi:hypothetical protein
MYLKLSYSVIARDLQNTQTQNHAFFLARYIRTELKGHYTFLSLTRANIARAAIPPDRGQVNEVSRLKNEALGVCELGGAALATAARRGAGTGLGNDVL